MWLNWPAEPIGPVQKIHIRLNETAEQNRYGFALFLAFLETKCVARFVD